MCNIKINIAAGPAFKQNPQADILESIETDGIRIYTEKITELNSGLVLIY